MGDAVAGTVSDGSGSNAGKNVFVGEETAALIAWQAMSKISNGIQKLALRMAAIIAVPIGDAIGHKSP